MSRFALVSHVSSLVFFLWPLLLTLARGLVAYRVNYHQSLEMALNAVEQAYQDQGVTAFRRDNVIARQQTVEACLEVSLRHLADFTHVRTQARERYQELAVFPEDIDIPLTEVQRFWQATGGLEPWETGDLCIRLHRLSLLLSCNLSNNGKIRLHSVLSSYLKQRARLQISTLHTRFLGAYWQRLHLKRWADLPENYRYLWQYLIWHLCRTGRRDALASTLTDLWYLTHKALYVGVAALEGDLLLACMQEETEAGMATSSFFITLHRAIVRISHLLQQATTKAEMGGLLLSHLGTQPSFADQKTVFERELSRPFITAWHPLPGASSALLRTFSHTSEVMGCAVSPDGSFIVSACLDGTLKVWDAATRKERFTLSGHTGAVSGCAVSPDGSFIVSSSSDGTLKVWNISTRTKPFTRSGYTDGVMGCAVSPDGRWIVSTDSWDGTHKIWDANTRAERFALSPLFGTLNTFKVWDSITGKEHFTLSGRKHEIIDYDISSDGRFIVSSSDGALKVWDIITGKKRFSFSDHTGEITNCVVSPDNRFIVFSSSDGTFKVWNITARTKPFTLPGQRGEITSYLVSPDSRFIVSASSDGTLKVWDIATRAEPFTLSGHMREITSYVVSPDSRFIVSVSQGDTTLQVWDITTRGKQFTLSGHTNRVGGCAVSPDSRFIVSVSWDKTLKVWESWTGRCVLTFPVDGELFGCAFYPDGEHLVACGGQGLYFLRLVK